MFLMWSGTPACVELCRKVPYVQTLSDRDHKNVSQGIAQYLFVLFLG